MEYFYLKNNEKLGPVSLDELLLKIDLNTKIWKEGMKDWEEAKNLEEIIDKLGKIPPPISNKEDDVGLFVSQKKIKEIKDIMMERLFHYDWPVIFVIALFIYNFIYGILGLIVYTGIYGYLYKFLWKPDFPKKDADVEHVKNYLNNNYDVHRFKSPALKWSSILFILILLFYTNPTKRQLKNKINKETININTMERVDLFLFSFSDVTVINTNPSRRIYIGLLNKHLKIFDEKYFK